jgi:glycosyltransferase involved in cell wall biosynthesis
VPARVAVQSLRHPMSVNSSTLRVALDLSPTRQGAGGTARGALGIRRALEARADVQLLAIGGGVASSRGTIAKKAMALYDDLLWHPLLARRAARRMGAHVLHGTAPRGPLSRGTPPFVITIHDLLVLRHPETMSTWNRLYSRATLRRMLEPAARVLPSSQDTADDLVRILGVPPEKIRYVPLGIEAHFFAPPPSLPPPVCGPYVLFVGIPEPRKNLSRLVEAVRRLRRAGRAERLVLAGSEGWGKVDVVDGADWIVRLGRVSEEQLRVLYANASCLAIPSLHEGFGLPAIEAMAAGCPVVAGRAGALPENCGDAAVLVDPFDVTSIADGIAEAIDAAESLVARGRDRAAAFRWERVAARLVEVYREIA